MCNYTNYTHGLTQQTYTKGVKANCVQLNPLNVLSRWHPAVSTTKEAEELGLQEGKCLGVGTANPPHFAPCINEQKGLVLKQCYYADLCALIDEMLNFQLPCPLYLPAWTNWIYIHVTATVHAAAHVFIQTLSGAAC